MKTPNLTPLAILNTTPEPVAILLLDLNADGSISNITNHWHHRDNSPTNNGITLTGNTAIAKDESVSAGYRALVMDS